MACRIGSSLCLPNSLEIFHSSAFERLSSGEKFKLNFVLYERTNYELHLLYCNYYRIKNQVDGDLSEESREVKAFFKLRKANSQIRILVETFWCRYSAPVWVFIWVMAQTVQHQTAQRSEKPLPSIFCCWRTRPLWTQAAARYPFNNLSVGVRTRRALYSI